MKAMFAMNDVQAFIEASLAPSGVPRDQMLLVMLGTESCVLRCRERRGCVPISRMRMAAHIIASPLAHRCLSMKFG